MLQPPATTQKALTISLVVRNERDWVTIFNIPRIEEEIKAGRFITLGDSKVPVVDGRKKKAKRPRYPLCASTKNPHGLNTSPDGKYFIANGKLSHLLNDCH